MLNDLLPWAALGFGIASGVINAFVFGLLGTQRGKAAGLQSALEAHNSPLVKAAMGLDVMIPKQTMEKLHAALSGAGDRRQRAAARTGEVADQRRRDISEARAKGYEEGLIEGQFDAEFQRSRGSSEVGSGEGSAASEREEALGERG